MKYRLYHAEFRADGSVRRVSLEPASSAAPAFWSLPDGRFGGSVMAEGEAEALAKLRAEMAGRSR